MSARPHFWLWYATHPEHEAFLGYGDGVVVPFFFNWLAMHKDKVKFFWFLKSAVSWVEQQESQPEAPLAAEPSGV